MKKKLFLLAFCSFGIFLFPGIIQAQVVIANVGPVNAVNGQITWNPTACPGGINFLTKDAYGAKTYNIGIAVYNGNYPTTKTLVPGAKVIFGEISAETSVASQPFSISGFPKNKYKTLTLVISGKNGLYKYPCSLFKKIPVEVPIKVTGSNCTNVVYEILCLAPVDAN